MQMILFAGLLLGAAPAAPQTSAAKPVDGAAVAAACGGDVTPEQHAAMGKAEAAAKLACFTREAATQFNRHLPMKVDEITTLERVSSEGGRLTYHYGIDKPAAEIPAALRDALKTAVRDNVCKAEDMRATIRSGGSYRYLWLDRARTPLVELVVSQC